MAKADTLERTAEQREQAAVKLAKFKAFVLAQTEIGSAVLVPEIKLRLARDARDIFSEAETFMDSGLGSRPYWSFAWPGGQGLARTILDQPELVIGKRVLDIGSGSGLGGIAALKAGAKSALAADIDPLAHAAAILNGELNDVPLQTTMADLLGDVPDTDLIVIGDLVYEPDLQIRVGSLLDTALKAGIPVLYGDRTTARRPRQDFVLLQEYEAPLMPALVEDFIERSRVWRLG